MREKYNLGKKVEVETNVRSMSFYPGFIQTLSNLFEETSLKQSPLSHLFEVTSIAVSNLDVYRSNSDSEAIDPSGLLVDGCHFEVVPLWRLFQRGCFKEVLSKRSHI